MMSHFRFLLTMPDNFPPSDNYRNQNETTKHSGVMGFNISA